MGELGLGSVQFGVDYGATRSEPRPAPTEVGEILHRAAGAGIRVVDTAPSYGDAESLLGTLRPAHARFRWVTKTAGPADAAAVRACLLELCVLCPKRELRSRIPRRQLWF